MSEVVVVDAVRTPIGRFQGALSGVRPDDLLALVLAEILQRNTVAAADVDEVIAGCANQAGEDNRNVARMALLLAGYPNTTPGVTVNRLCASGLEAVNQGFRSIRCGDAQVVVAGGVESMSRAPYSMPRAPQHPKAGNLQVWDTSLGWRYPNPRMDSLFPLESMGETAENLVERFGISREDQDRFAEFSHRKAVHAHEKGWFERELTPVELPSGAVASDEGPRADTSVSALAKLKPAFRKNGSVTAGNSSGLNDGAAAVLLMAAESARQRGLIPRLRVVSCASAGVDPRIMGCGPVPAVRKALAKAGLTVNDIDLWEINEAFAAQVLTVTRELALDESKVNVHGGAIALGHPLGCSGARLVATLAGALERTGGRFGVATLCVGVGQGVATVFERL